MTDALARWHHYFESHNPDDLRNLLAEDVIFESPVVHTPQVGKPITFAYLSAAAKVLGGDGFRYVGEWRADRSAILEFEQTLDGIRINGVDMIWWNEANLITRFKVMVRPLKAVNMLHAMMGVQLSKG